MRGYSTEENKTQALHALDGIGDPSVGQWEEPPDKELKAYHVRRRLTPAEASKVGPAIDIRKTPEADLRLRKVSHLLPAGYTE